MPFFRTRASVDKDEVDVIPPERYVPHDHPLPYPHERHFDKLGFAYYSDHEAKTTSRLNSLMAKALELEGKQDRDLIMVDTGQNSDAYLVHYGRDVPMGKIVGACSSGYRKRGWWKQWLCG